MLTQEEKDQAMNICIELFDFAKVHQTMDILGWTWKDGMTPSIGKIVVTAYDLMRQAIAGAEKTGKEYICSIGGFKVEAQIDESEDPKLYLNLMFYISDVSNVF